jgi:hypothetical protein
MTANRRREATGDGPMRIGMAGCALAFAAVLGGSSLAVAQDQADRGRLYRHAPLRVDVTPAGRLYRQCTDWHVIEHRATGDTVVPRTRCWWAVR